jgi:hypothetical protein
MAAEQGPTSATTQWRSANPQQGIFQRAPRPLGNAIAGTGAGDAPALGFARRSVAPRRADARAQGR